MLIIYQQDVKRLDLQARLTICANLYWKIAVSDVVPMHLNAIHLAQCDLSSLTRMFLLNSSIEFKYIPVWISF